MTMLFTICPVFFMYSTFAIYSLSCFCILYDRLSSEELKIRYFQEYFQTVLVTTDFHYMDGKCLKISSLMFT